MNINGTQNEPTKKAFDLYTGLQAVKILAVNPTNEEYDTIVGRELPFELNYEEKTDDRGKSRLIRFLCQHVVTGTYQFCDFYIRDNYIANKDNNKFKFIDAKGQITYYVDTPETILGNPNVNWYSGPMTKCRVGEDLLITFMQRLIGYSAKNEESKWTEDLKNEGYDINNIFSGNVTVLRNFIKFANTSGRYIAMPFTVQKSESSTGEVKVNQRIETRHPVYSSCYTLEDGSVAFNNKNYTSTIDEIHKGGRNFSTRLYTKESMKFDESKCITSTPKVEEPTTQASW